MDLISNVYALGMKAIFISIYSVIKISGVFEERRNIRGCLVNIYVETFGLQFIEKVLHDLISFTNDTLQTMYIELM